MIWSVVAHRYMESFERARARFERPSTESFCGGLAGNRPGIICPLLKLDHLLQMTAAPLSFGHAIFNVPKHFVPTPWKHRLKLKHRGLRIRSYRARNSG